MVTTVYHTSETKMYYAACKFEFHPFNRSYSQLTFFNFYKMIIASGGSSDNNNNNKGSAWVSAFAGTHAPGRAGQHFDLFDSIFDRE